MPLTVHRIGIETKEGKSFLRKVVRGNDEWKITATPDNEWKIMFYRTVPGEVGQPDEDVEVHTDATIRVRESEFGENTAFSDAKPVYVPMPKRVWTMWDTDTRDIAKILADGGSLWIDVNRGSTRSSEHGISTIELRGKIKGYRNSLLLGQTLLMNGSTLWSGPADCY